MQTETTSPSKTSAAHQSRTADPLTTTASPNGHAGFEEAGPTEVAQLAHTLWQARGCPDGSPEEDWFRAEQTLKGTTE